MKKIIKNHLQRIGERQMNQSIGELIKDEELRNIIKTHRLPENGTLDYIWGLKDKNFLFQWIGNGYSINEISKQAVDLRKLLCSVHSSNAIMLNRNLKSQLCSTCDYTQSKII